ncbi:hypothetical protein ACFC6U_27895 [Kitasatospora purpeofusca]|uniref:hypothetical protein n=1 Tax=Kitasatospora purpeofusca TaxID=67352 RepID=UPI0035E26C26
MPRLPLPLPPELLDTLIDAGNKALNDHYHEDLCSCSLWPASCATSTPYFPGYWDTNAFAHALPAIIAAYEQARTANPPVADETTPSDQTEEPAHP